VGVESEQRPFWTSYQPGFRSSASPIGTPEFFREVEEHRYRLEPHIPEVARFAYWRGRDVLEVGCGIATDGARFARAGADYVGVDLSPTALELARRRFELEGLAGRFEHASATELPFEDASFDLVYSHGVIHHIPETERAVEEFHRVLRPGGEAVVMLYHRDSLNYRVTIMLVRRLLALALLAPGAASVISRLVGEDEEVLEGHRELLRRHRLHYLTDRQLFLSNNTDGPGNPLSKVYSRSEARRLFASFGEVQIAVRYLNLRLLPGGERVAATVFGRRLARRIGWHLYVRAKRQ
jgi:ubiquinone/menaquinone biosynthesis C-methylase UbiE